MTRVAYPFVRPSEECVQADTWMLCNDDAVRELPPYLDGWDYNTSLRLQREIRIELAELKEGARLTSDAQLALAVGAFSTNTWLRSRPFHRVLKENTEQVLIELELPGVELGGNLRLRTAVILDQAATTQETFVAHLAASTLWDDLLEVRLQGDAPLFPISVIDFGRAGWAHGAGWHLDIGPNLDAPLHASLRLYLNDAHAAVVWAFANAGAPSRVDRAILRAVYADVARVLVEHALNQETLYHEAPSDRDSLGYALHALLNRFFPGADLKATQIHRIDHPADFSTELLSKLKVFDD